MNDISLTHWGVKGMKWGVRRYQNKDGSLTAAGKERYSEENKKKARSTAAKVVLGAATVAVAAYTVHENIDSIGKVVSAFKNVAFSDIAKKGSDAGKAFVKNAIEGAKEGVKEASKEAPKKATKAVVTGVVLNQTKKILDEAVGKEESAKIFQANDNKKIGKFWKVSPDDKDDD